MEGVPNHVIKILYELRDEGGIVWQSYGDEDNFFPSCLPYINQTAKNIDDNKTKYEVRKYYHPLRGFSISTQMYDRVLCYATTEGVDECLKK